MTIVVGGRGVFKNSRLGIPEFNVIFRFIYFVGLVTYTVPPEMIFGYYILFTDIPN